MHLREQSATLRWNWGPRAEWIQGLKLASANAGPLCSQRTQLRADLQTAAQVHEYGLVIDRHGHGLRTRFKARRNCNNLGSRLWLLTYYVQQSSIPLIAESVPTDCLGGKPSSVITERMSPAGRVRVSLCLNSRRHCGRRATGCNVRYLARNSTFCGTGFAAFRSLSMAVRQAARGSLPATHVWIVLQPRLLPTTDPHPRLQVSLSLSPQIAISLSFY